MDGDCEFIMSTDVDYPIQNGDGCMAKNKPQQLVMALVNLEKVVIPPPQGGKVCGGNGGGIGLGGCGGVGGE